MSANVNGPYVPALRFRWLTKFYDRVLSWTLREEAFKRALVEQANVEPGHRVLDVGCGTATLTLLLKQACPAARVVGMDGDPDVLELAKRKIDAAGVEIELRRGLAGEPPFEPASFDRVVSSLVFHHLSSQAKRQAFGKIKELLSPGGELHLADWGEAQNALMRMAFLPVQLLDGFENTADNVAGRLLPMMREAGFGCVEETARRMTVFGTLSLYRATA